MLIYNKLYRTNPLSAHESDSVEGERTHLYLHYAWNKIIANEQFESLACVLILINISISRNELKTLIITVVDTSEPKQALAVTHRE